MNWRFTLSHEVLGSQIITEPGGWGKHKNKLLHHPEFFSRVESLEVQLTFYGRNDQETLDGGILFINQVENGYGLKAKVILTVEYTEDDVNYSDYFTGYFPIKAIHRNPDNTCTAPLLKDSLWDKFLNRYDTPVNLSDLVDLDGEAVAPVVPIIVSLPPQLIRKQYSGRYKYAYELGNPEDEGFEYAQLDFENEILNEIEGKITLSRILTNSVLPIFEMEEAGNYDFDIKITLGHNTTIDPNFSYSTLGKYVPWIQINEETPVAFTGTDVTHGADVVTEWVYNDTIALSPKDTVKIYVQDLYDFSTDRLFIFGDEGFEFSGAFNYGESYMNVTGQTSYPATRAQGYLIHDLIHGVLARIGLGIDPFYSEFLGSTLTNTKAYDEDGCGWMYGIFKGLQLRQYGLNEKPFFISMKQIWEGINPILNLGLGYEIVDSIEVIRIEQKRHFIGSTKAVNFSNVYQISSDYDDEFIFKAIKTGYKRWQSEDIAGIDDPQTKHTYSTTIDDGEEKPIESDFIAASYAIEVTRRTTRIKSADYKFDNETFIISLNTDDISPDVYEPELDENFSSVTNLLNSSSRYNLVLTPMRNFLRWAAFFGGCLQSYLTSSYKFVSGEGNYDMASDAILGTCERAVIGDNLSESADIPLGAPTNYNTAFGYYFLPILYDITIPMEKEEFDLIDRKQPIGISQTDSGHAEFHIKELEYEIIKGEAVIKAWPKVFFDITVPDQEIATPICE